MIKAKEAYDNEFLQNSILTSRLLTRMGKNGDSLLLT